MVFFFSRQFNNEIYYCKKYKPVAVGSFQSSSWLSWVGFGSLQFVGGLVSAVAGPTAGVVVPVAAVVATVALVEVDPAELMVALFAGSPAIMGSISVTQL